MKIVTWKGHIYRSTNGIYDMIQGRDILTALRLDLIFSENSTLDREVTYEGFSAPMVDISNYDFNIIAAETV